jgi:hypothetical protein
MNNKNAGVLIAVGAVFLSVVITVCSTAQASRNSSGTMSAVNGPYVSGTTISSAQINQRFADIENEITDSLSRSGKGGMTAVIKEADGTSAAPAYSFTNEAGSGLYRVGAGDLGLAVLGTKVQDWTSNGVTSLLTDGAVGTPSMTFLADLDTGFYRVGANDFAAVAGGAKVAEFTSTGLAVTGAVSATTTLTSTTLAGFNGVVSSLSAGATSHEASTATQTDFTGALSHHAFAIETNHTSNNYLPGLTWFTSDDNATKPKAAIYVQDTGSGSVLELGTSSNYATGVTANTTIDQNGKLTAPGGVAFSSTSGAVSNTFSGSYSITPGTIAGNACVESAQTLNGTALGDVCMAGSNAALGSSAGNSGAMTCYVLGANTVTFRFCATNGGWTPPSTTYTARTFH